jgi:hypothetical protein
MPSRSNPSEGLRPVATLLREGAYIDVAKALRARFDEVDNAEFARELSAQLISEFPGTDADGWTAVAQAPSLGDSPFNLAVMLWSGAEWERTAIEILRIAVTEDSRDAPLALAEYLLCWTSLMRQSNC